MFIAPALRTTPYGAPTEYGVQKFKIMRFRSGNLCYYERKDGFKDMVVIVGQVGDDYWITINPETLAELQSVSAEKLSPVPISKFNVEILGFRHFAYSEEYGHKWRTVDGKCDLICDTGNWSFSHHITETYVLVRYLHEVQNLIDVLNDFE